MVEHRPETDAADIPVGRSINSVAERHVVSRHRLCDCARGAADKKEAARDFLAGANFRERPVAFGVEISLERLLVRSDIHLGFHNFQDVGICRLLNRRVRNAKMTSRYPHGVIPSGCEGTSQLVWGYTNNREILRRLRGSG